MKHAQKTGMQAIRSSDRVLGIFRLLKGLEFFRSLIALELLGGLSSFRSDASCVTGRGDPFCNRACMDLAERRLLRGLGDRKARASRSRSSKQKSLIQSSHALIHSRHLKVNL
jgi:hypothetical protein